MYKEVSTLTTIFKICSGCNIKHCNKLLFMQILNATVLHEWIFHFLRRNTVNEWTGIVIMHLYSVDALWLDYMFLPSQHKMSHLAFGVGIETFILTNSWWMCAKCKENKSICIKGNKNKKKAFLFCLYCIVTTVFSLGSLTQLWGLGTILQ